MKAKYAIIPFIPAALAMLFLKLMSLFGLDGNGTFMGMSKMNITYVVIGIALGLFVVCILMNLFDRKTAQVYPVKKNPVAGVFAILTGFSVMAASITTASNIWMNDPDNKERLILAIVCAVFSVPSGLSFAMISRVHFTGKNDVSGLSALYVFPSLWGCAELVDEFLQATKASIYAKDASALFCFIFLSLFFFSNSMVISRIRGRNPVKGLFIYGLPMTALTLTYGTYEFFRMMREGFDRAELFFALLYVSAAVYALSFLFEVFANYYTKDDFEVVSSLDEIDEEADFDIPDEPQKPAKSKKFPKAEQVVSPEIVEPEISTAEPAGDVKAEAVEGAGEAQAASGSAIGDLVFSDRAASNEPNVAYDDDYYSTAKGMDDFIMGFNYDSYDESQEDEKVKNKKKDKKDKKDKKKLTPKNESPFDPVVIPTVQDELKEELKENREEDQAAAKAQKAANAGKQSVEDVLAASLKKKSRNQAPAKDSSSNVQKLTEELKKAAESRKRANEEALGAVKENEKEIREEIIDAANADEKKAEEERLALQIKRVEAARKVAAQKAEEAKKAEAAERAAEEAKKAEAAERAAEEAKKAEAAKRAAEEAKKAEAAKRAAEEAKKAEAAKRAAEEAKKAEAAKRAAEEAKKAEAAKRAAAEAAGSEQDNAEAVRRAVEARRAEEQRRISSAQKAEKINASENADDSAEARNAIAQGEEAYRAKLNRADELLKKLGDKK